MAKTYKLEKQVQTVLAENDIIVNQKVAAKLTKELFEMIKTELIVLEDGDKLDLGVLGKLVKKVRKEMNSRNPQTGEAIVIPEQRVIKFTPSKTLKDSVK